MTVADTMKARLPADCEFVHEDWGPKYLIYAPGENKNSTFYKPQFNCQPAPTISEGCYTELKQIRLKGCCEFVFLSNRNSTLNNITTHDSTNYTHANHEAELLQAQAEPESFKSAEEWVVFTAHKKVDSTRECQTIIFGCFFCDRPGDDTAKKMAYKEELFVFQQVLHIRTPRLFQSIFVAILSLTKF